MIPNVRKDFMVFEQRDFIVNWFTALTFYMLEAMFANLTNEAALSLFCELGLSSKD